MLRKTIVCQFISTSVAFRLEYSQAMVPFKRWIKPEVYPLFLAMGVALSACGFTIARNLTINPDVRISKNDREAGMLENYKEGETYKNHSLRKYLTKQDPMIMSAINNHFSAAK